MQMNGSYKMWWIVTVTGSARPHVTAVVLLLQEWLELLQRRVGPSKPEPGPPGKKATTEQKEEEKKEEADKKEVGQREEGQLAEVIFMALQGSFHIQQV